MTRRWVAMLAVSAIMALAAGCGSSDRATVASLSPPAVIGPTTSRTADGGTGASTVPPAPNSYEKLDVTFTSAQVGYLVAVGNVHYGGETTAIRRTTDGGATWQPIWTGRDLFLDWIGQAGPDLVALGAQAPQTQVGDAGFLPDGKPVPWEPVVVTSTDGGVNWAVADATMPASVQNEKFVVAFATATDGVAVPDPDYFQYPSNGTTEQMLRTTDGGHTWTLAGLPDGVPTGGVAFTSPTTGFVTGATATDGGACQARLWKMTDDGATWSAVAGTCFPYGISGLSFPTPQVGYAVGGTQTDGDDGPASFGVAITTDGGATWTSRYVGALLPLAHTFTVDVFTSPTTGYALAASCQGSGGEGSCAGPLWQTNDSGRTWTQTGLFGAELAAPAGGQAHVVDGIS